MLQMVTNPIIMVNVIKKHKSFGRIYRMKKKAKDMKLRHWTTKLLGKLSLFDVADVKFSILMQIHRYTLLPPTSINVEW